MPRQSKSRKIKVQKAMKMRLMTKSRKKSSESKGNNPSTSADNKEDSIQIATSSGPHHSSSDLFVESLEENDNITKTSQKLTENPIQVETSPEPQQVPSCFIEGRRIINIAYFYSQLKEIAKHGVIDCGLESVDIVGERQVGLHSLFTFKCSMCMETFCIENDSR